MNEMQNVFKQAITGKRVFLHLDHTSKVTWYFRCTDLRQYTPDGELHIDFAINADLPTGDSWDVWNFGTSFDNDRLAVEWADGDVYLRDWYHVTGFAEKQPKTDYKRKIIDKFVTDFGVDDIGDVATQQLAKQDATLFSTFVEPYQKIPTGDMETQTAELAECREKIDTLSAENAELRKASTTPSVDELLMRTLVDKLEPAIDQKAHELADSVMKNGSLPKVLKVEIGEKVSTTSGVFNDVFEDVLLLCANEIPVFLTGEAGTGKNHLAEQVADAMGLPFWYMGQVMDKYTDCVGFMDANGRTHDTPLIRAVRNGGVLFIDEIDASIPEALITCNALLANGYMVTGWGERIDAHEDFRVLCAGNTLGTGADNVYTGRYALDGASLDRFAMVRVDYDVRVEMAMAGDDVELVSFVRSFRDGVRSAGMHVPVSYRSIARMAKLHNAGMEPKRILETSLLKTLSWEERKVIHTNMRDNGVDVNTWCFVAFSEMVW